MAELKCLSCIHGELCLQQQGGVNLAIISEVCEHYKSTANVAEVKHGYWIDKPTGRYCHVGSWCSVCQEKSGIGGIESNRHKPYCPNCGARMDGTPKERGADKPKVTCLNCKYLEITLPYGECSRKLRMVEPDDTCEYAEPKERGGEK